MYQLLKFIKSVYVLLLFIALECGALLFYAYSDSYTNARIIGAIAWVNNSVNSSIGAMKSYVGLNSENKALTHRIAQLETELSIYRNIHIDSLLRTMVDSDNISEIRIAARVVTNTINRRHNHIIIDKGMNNGVREKMAVVTPLNQMVGEVVSSYDDYAVVMSVLNTHFRSIGRVVNSDHAGSISWDGESRYSVNMSHLSKYAEPFEGAEVITTNFSSIFPEGVTIGKVNSFRHNSDKTTYELEIELAADISALDKVIVVGRTRDSEVEYINEMVTIEKR